MNFQLLRGASDSELRQYDISRDPAKYLYTNQGSMETLSEKADYKQTCSAFKILGFSEDEISTVWKVVAAILHLGNVEFKCG